MPFFNLFLLLFAARNPKAFLVCVAIVLYCLWHAFGGSVQRPNFKLFDGRWDGTRVLTWHAAGHRCDGAGAVSFIVRQRHFQFPIIEPRDPNGVMEYLAGEPIGKFIGVFGDHYFQGSVIHGQFDAIDRGPACSWHVRATRVGDVNF